MKNEITLQTRREFLRSTVLGSAVAWTVPAFLANTFAALQADAADSSTQIVTGKDSTILVVLQMAGGNDGLNTVVPYTSDFYHRARPKIGLPAQQVLDLTRVRWNDMPQQRGKMIQLKTELSSQLPPVAGSETEIREALINLVFNAVDAMPEGGTLTLRTKIGQTARHASGSQQVHLEVADTGVGMDDATRRRCLEPFFTTKGERGTGLGLAMVYGIAQRHNAEIEIESATGKGTTVRLDFPVSLAEGTGHDHPETVAPPPARLRLLVVDDDPLLTKSLRDTLEADGHAVVTASGGQEGIDVFNASERSGERFAAVITDLGMPYVDGRKVAKAVKETSPSKPVIMLTGWGQRLVAEGDIPPHVDRVLNKPPKLRELRSALAELVAAAR